MLSKSRISFIKFRGWPLCVVLYNIPHRLFLSITLLERCPTLQYRRRIVARNGAPLLRRQVRLKNWLTKILTVHVKAIFLTERPRTWTRTSERKNASRRPKPKSQFSSITRMATHRPLCRYRIVRCHSHHCRRFRKMYVFRTPPTLDRSWPPCPSMETNPLRSTKRSTASGVDVSDSSTVPGLCTCPKRLDIVFRCIPLRSRLSRQLNSPLRRLPASLRLRYTFINIEHQWRQLLVIVLVVLGEITLLWHVGSGQVAVEKEESSNHASWCNRDSTWSIQQNSCE